MKLQQQITTINQILNDLETKIEEMEQQEYMTYDLGKDLQNISFMIDMLKEEIEKKEELK